MAPLVEALDLHNTTTAYHSPATLVRGDARLIHVSGQVGATKANHVPADYESQIHLALLNLRKVMLTAGAQVRDIAKLNLYIVDYDPSQRKHTRHIQRFLKGHRPAITLVPVPQLAMPGWLFEVDAVIAVPAKPVQEIPRALSSVQAVDVVILGAGLAGLAAAHVVHQAGLSCVVLEARDRVGGKTWSQPTADGKALIELGAAWVNDVNQPRMIDWVRKLGLETIEQNTAGNVVFQDFDGNVSDFAYGDLPKFDPATRADVARIRDMCEADCQKLSVAKPQDTGLDALTFEAYLRSRGASTEALATATVWTRAMLGLEPADMSALYFLNYCRSGGGLLQMRSDRKGGGQALRLRAGTQAISKGMAAALPTGMVKLGAPATNVVQEGPAAVRVDAAGTSYRARKVITTVPSPALKMINFEPALHPVKQAWSESAGYGYYVKAIVVFKTPFWVTKGFCGLVQSFTGPASVIRDTSSPSDDKHALTCFMVGQPGASWGAQSAEDQKKTLLAQIGKLYGVDAALIADNFVEMVTFDWSLDPWTGGGCPCTSLTPGVLDTLGSSSLREPIGNLHFAGTETAAEWKGYMEGAVCSGERAAQEVLEGLSAPMAARL